MIVKELKTALFEQCFQVVEKRHQKIKQTISDIEESLLEETSSSAGDKHETGRAMLQIDRENAGRQLLEVENLQALVKKIDIRATSDYARLGSLIYTNQGAYFIGISIGAVAIGKTTYMCVALHSPIGNQLSGKKKGDVFLFNNLEYTVTQVS
ncbi:hypothetical protein ATE92_1121 [Ulvibacter sp. MAR_2010_11]|uniref:3-oxoacyl-ACP synthase n=1 Tax=Ulvibacter sp. MAR_2010_11 TaxID=1250229 RepID=UPI000C2CB519|nr:3-oxoacyl-ACP synthase [Ulvibacter sp. MAR_2010_11]PKA82977.1 hypothetical protein ATE92_1121 [Ulvibacter sp. MAR_2010_11]